MPRGIYKRKTGWHHPEKTRERIKNSLKGRKYSETRRERISNALKGRATWNKGKKLSEKHRLNLSKSHKGLLKGSKHPRWKGGRFIDKKGYVCIKKDEHPFSSPLGYIREHRIVMEKKIGRFLHRWESVHHINQIRDDNRPENLKLCKSNAEHKKYHKKTQY